jgi:5-methylcytosine-specific restriction endonuclease McrA
VLFCLTGAIVTLTLRLNESFLKDKTEGCKLRFPPRVDCAKGSCSQHRPSHSFPSCRPLDEAATRGKMKYPRSARMHTARSLGTHTPSEWQALVAEFGGHCLSCMRLVGFSRLTRDHIKPVSYGGSDAIENIQPLCGFCNTSKLIDEWNAKAYWRPILARNPALPPWRVFLRNRLSFVFSICEVADLYDLNPSHFW